MMFDITDISKFEKLYTLLYNYECDEPYDQDEEPVDHIRASEALDSLRIEHCGDCINIPMSCPRCFAEECKRKAEWILERL